MNVGPTELIVLAWVVAPVVLAAILTSKRNRSGWWTLLAVFFGWLGLIGMLFLTDQSGPKCPLCMNANKAGATVCGSCGRDLQPAHL